MVAAIHVSGSAISGLLMVLVLSVFTLAAAKQVDDK